MSKAQKGNRDENQLERIVAAEAAGLKLLADLIASFEKWQLSKPRGKCAIGDYHGVDEIRGHKPEPG